jgi:hypothetical protein
MMHTYDVEVTVTLTLATTITVQAVSKGDAREQAETMAQEDFDYTLGATLLDWEEVNEAWTIMGVKEREDVTPPTRRTGQ